METTLAHVELSLYARATRNKHSPPLLGNRRSHIFFTPKPFGKTWGEENWKRLWLKRCSISAYATR
eukprot:10233927-Lingulodinium_polyedra.AAC.1